jgi:hypothetical protein
MKKFVLASKNGHLEVVEVILRQINKIGSPIEIGK